MLCCCIGESGVDGLVAYWRYIHIYIHMYNIIYWGGFLLLLLLLLLFAWAVSGDK